MDLLKSLGHAAQAVQSRAGKIAGGAERGASQVVTSTFSKDTYEKAKDVTLAVGNAAERVGQGVVHIPGAVSTWPRVASAIVTGQRTELPGEMPAYVKLDARALAAAKAAGSGKTADQPYLVSDPKTGSPSEPVTMTVTATKDELVRALERQGWVQNDARTPKNYVRQGLAVLTHYDRVSNAPVSKQYLNGKLEDMAFSKNCDYNLSRDHMRIYQQGTDPVTNKPVWAIASSRDVAATMTVNKPDTHGSPLPWKWDVKAPGFGHETDPNDDGERDLIMQDLLDSGMVKDFQAVTGKPVGDAWKRQPDGRMAAGSHLTDGTVYQVALGDPT